MQQVAFAENAKNILENDPSVEGLAVAGSWLTNELDEFSDVDLIVVTKHRMSDSPQEMVDFAARLGNLLTAFTGEHVGEKRLLICLYNDPLLHVDLKFVTWDEFRNRIENPVILLDKEGKLKEVLDTSAPLSPFVGYQWIEDRFWTWVHYALLKIGRGEYLEASDFLGFLRLTVLGPLLAIKNGKLPRGVRKVEAILPQDDLNHLISTISDHSRKSLLECLRNMAQLYIGLSNTLYGPEIKKHMEARKKVLEYLEQIETGKPNE